MLKLKCARHPRFNGINPRASCEICIALAKMRSEAYIKRITVITQEAKHEVSRKDLLSAS